MHITDSAQVDALQAGGGPRRSVLVASAGINKDQLLALMSEDFARCSTPA